ncbi:hypothetical protein H0A73_06290 [Alcaligenaceae bacterium]|nr:hypothetical protein [Alcaligenaceae bacterium]
MSFSHCGTAAFRQMFSRIANVDITRLAKSWKNEGLYYDEAETGMNTCVHRKIRAAWCAAT